MKSYKFKLYEHKRNRHLKRVINTAGWIYNHCISLHKRYYRIFGKHLNCAKLQKHIAKLRKKNSFWQKVGSQALQDICQRIERSYQLFFKNSKKGVRPPSFKKVRRYKSFTLKQAGYKFLNGNQIRIGKRVFKFWKSREIEGKIKTVTVKRTPLGELFLIVVTDKQPHREVSVPRGANSESCADFVKIETSKIAGFDFGLKVFLTCSEGFDIQSPQFFKRSLNAIKKASKHHSKKTKGSARRERARKHLVRQHEAISNRRQDWFWKLAHQLTDQFDVLCFETLNLKAMQRLWGRKVGDLGFAKFLETLQWVARKKGKHIVYIDPWYPSSKTCSGCHHKLDTLELSVRQWRCPNCQQVNDRDKNAAKNIKMVGASTIGLGDVRQVLPAVAA